METPDQIVVGSHRGDKVLDFDQSPHLLALDAGFNAAPQSLVTDMFPPRFQPSDVRLNLFDKGEMIAQLFEPGVWRQFALLPKHVRAGGDQRRVDAVSL